MKTLSRRTLLRGAGGVGIALPFRDAMWPRVAKAAEVPKRFFVMTGVNGVVPQTWFPTGGEKDFKLGASMAALEPLREHLIIPDRIRKMQRGTTDGTAHGRGAASAVTGWTASGKNGVPDGASIDQVIANAIGTKSRIKSLMTGRVYNYYFFADGPKQVHPVEPDPQKNFDRLFTGFTAPAASTGAPDPNAAADLTKLRMRKKSILDAAMEQYKKVAADVGPKDRIRLEKHLGSIRQVEQQLENASNATGAASQGCMKPAGPEARKMGDDDYAFIGKANLKLAALAFACDITRVGGLQWISHGQVFSWLGISEKHHPLAHQCGAAGPDAQLTKLVGWHAEQAAAFLTDLKSFQEGAGTVLDNTIFLWTNEQSVGNHKFERGPFLIASGKFPLASGGTLQTGRYLQFSDNPHTQLLQSITMAVAGVKMPVYGEWDKGPLPGLF
jgi:Protein of unknown function (DUF1552)